jgi:hypothetical protein
MTDLIIFSNVSWFQNMVTYFGRNISMIDERQDGISNIFTCMCIGEVVKAN